MDVVLWVQVPLPQHKPHVTGFTNNKRIDMDFSEQEKADIRKAIGMCLARLRHKIRWHERTGGGNSPYKDNILIARKERVNRLEELVKKFE